MDPVFPSGSMAMHDLLTQLTQGGLLNADEQAAAETWVDQRPDESAPPWYVAAFVGASAWLAAFFILSFLGVAGLIENGASMLLFGGLFCVAALLFKWFARRSIFVGQLAFAISLAGQGLLIVGTGMQMDNITGAAFAALALEAFLFIVYPDTMHRLISVVAIIAALLVLLVEYEIPNAVHMGIALVSMLAIFLWQNEARLRATKNLAGYWSASAYGTLLTLFALCVLPLIDQFGATRWWISSVFLALGLCVLCAQLLREFEIPLQSAPALWLFAGVGLLLIPTYQTPGILAGLLGLLLAFWRSNNLQMGISSLFLLFFIGVYYYNLEFTLLEKSYILMGTGLVLLIARFGLVRFGLVRFGLAGVGSQKETL